MADSSSTQERYSHGYGETSKGLASRTAQTQAGFLVPHLRAGMSVLDAGCGPGSITATLAEIIAPGNAVGIDVSDVQIERATSLASERGVENIEFRVATAYEIPFDDAAFDVVFSHTVLQHLSDPVRALKEGFRVLKPGGLLGIREEDWGSLMYWPQSALMRQAHDLYFRYWKHNGGDPFLPRRYRQILRESGFEDLSIGGDVNLRANDEETAGVASYGASHWLEPVFADTVIGLGWVTHDELEELAASFTLWASQPDTLYGLVFCHALARKPE